MKVIKFYSTEEMCEMVKIQRKDKKNKIKTVDNTLNNLGIYCKMSVGEKLLYYENFIDSDNKFKGIIEFFNMDILILANYLIVDNDTYNEFISMLDKNKIIHSVLAFRDFQFKQNRGQGVNSQDIENLIQNQNWNDLHHILQELFLEPFSIINTEYFVNFVANKKTTIDDMLEWHKENPSLRFERYLNRFTLDD